MEADNSKEEEKMEEKKIKKRPMSQKELKDLGVTVKVVYLEKGQNEKEAIEEEAQSSGDGEIYLVVMPKGERLPDDEEEKLNGYSVDNPYHDEKKDDKDKEANTTAAMTEIIEKADVAPVPEDTPQDPTATLQIAKPTDNYLVGETKYDMQEKPVTAESFMTLEGSGMGYNFMPVRQLGMLQNNYSMGYRALSKQQAGDQLSLYENVLSKSLSLAATTPKTIWVAPGKKEYKMRFQVEPQLLCDVGIVEKLQALQTELSDASKIINGVTPEARKHKVRALEELITTLTLRSDNDNKPLGIDDPIPLKSFDTLVDEKIYTLRMALQEIDVECMVPEDYWDNAYKYLQTTDKQIAAEPPEYIRHRNEYYDVKAELHEPMLITRFLQDSRNREFAAKLTIPQVLKASYEGAVLPLSNVGASAGDLAASLRISTTTVTSDGQLANMASANKASMFLHNYVASLLHEDLYLTYPLISSQRMYTSFDLAIMMDALFYPTMLNFLVIDFDSVRALRNYIYYFLCRPIFDLVDILVDGDSSKDMLHEFLVSGIPPGTDANRRKLYGAMRRFYGVADFAELGDKARAGTFNNVPGDYTSNLTSERGGYRELAVDGVMSELIFREERPLLYSNVRNGMPGGTMLNGTLPTVSEKPRVGIWTHATEFANAFHTCAQDPNMKRVIAAVDGNTIISMAKIFKKIIETRTVGFQHRLNEINYFTSYMGRFGYVYPKSILNSLNYDIGRAPELKEIQPGSIYSSVCLTAVSDLRRVVLPDAKQLIDSQKMYNNLESFMVTYQMVKDLYSPDALQEYIGYDRPIKRSNNTDKMLLMQAFSIYGTASPVVNALKAAIETVTLDYFDGWFFPTEEIRLRVMPKHSIYRKFVLYFNYLSDKQVLRDSGVAERFWMSKLKPDEGIDEDTNGGMTRRTEYKAVRRVDCKLEGNPTEEYDEEKFFSKYVHGEDYDAMFKHLNKIRAGEEHVMVNIPVNWSITEMNPDAVDEMSSSGSFPLTWNEDAASSVKAKDVVLSYWPGYNITGERAADHKYMFTGDKYARTDFNPILTVGDRFLDETDLISREENGHIKRLNKIPERMRKLRPERRFFNPVVYDTGNL